MGPTQALVRLPQEYKIKLPSEFCAVSMRKLSGRDQVTAAAQFKKDNDRYSMELIRLVVLVPGSVTQENPAGVTAFTQDSVLDLDLEDINYLTQAMTKLNGMDKLDNGYTFDF